MFVATLFPNQQIQCFKPTKDTLMYHNIGVSTYTPNKRWQKYRLGQVPLLFVTLSDCSRGILIYILIGSKYNYVSYKHNSTYSNTFTPCNVKHICIQNYLFWTLILHCIYRHTGNLHLVSDSDCGCSLRFHCYIKSLEACLQEERTVDVQ